MADWRRRTSGAATLTLAMSWNDVRGFINVSRIYMSRVFIGQVDRETLYFRGLDPTTSRSMQRYIRQDGIMYTRVYLHTAHTLSSHPDRQLCVQVTLDTSDLTAASFHLI